MSDMTPINQEPQGTPQQSNRVVKVALPHSAPYVSYSLMAITVIVYLLQFFSKSLLGSDLPAMLGIKANELIMQGQLWRLITPTLLHGSLMHIVVNMYALNAFGPGLERYFGHGRFFLLYLLSGFAGNVFSFIFTPAYSLGSSTAIFGLLGAEGVFLYQNRQMFGNTAQRALVNIAMVAGINLVIGLSPGIDNWGHVGGLLGGVIFSWFAGPLLTVEGIYPSVEIKDQRESRDVIWVGVGVGLLFALIAAAIIYLR